MKAFINLLVQRGLVVNLISVFLLAIGIYATLNINREAFPDVNMDQIMVSTVYPGASPKEVELLVITPIEQELRSLDGIDKMISMSFPGSGRITLEVDPDAKNRDQITNDISLAVSRAKLPSELPFDPHVTEIEGSIIPIIRLAISAPVSDLQLKRLSNDIKDDLLNVRGVAKIHILGDRKAEIRIVVDPEKLRQEHVSVTDIQNAVRGWNLNAPGGDITTEEGQKVVRIAGELFSAEDAGNLVLRTNASGDTLRVKDVANVVESLSIPRMTYDVGGKPGISMLVLKKSDADIINTVDRIHDYIDGISQKYGEDVTISSFQDFSKFTRMRLGVLTSNGKVGLLLVFISLILFLRFSVAMMATIGLPIIFMSGLFMLYMSGITLNLISMMGFIMVLGMLVDDAILIGENITYHMEKGMAPKVAAVHGTMELMGPVTASILTTIASFVPMMFMSGIIGKFVIAIPIVVIMMLALSWLESFFILPSHVAHFTNPNKHPKERAWLLTLDSVYSKVLTIALRFRWITVGLSVAVLVFALLLAKTMPFQLFPPAGVDEFMVRVTAEPGTSLTKMRNQLRVIDKELRKNLTAEYVQATLITAGEIAMDQGDPLTQRGSRYGQIRAIYTPAVSRPDHEVMDEMYAAERIITAKFEGLEIAFTAVQPGPPLGRALEAEINSSDEEESNTAARRLIAFLNDVEGVTSIDSGLKRGDDEIHVVMDRELATYAGVDLAAASSIVRAASGGLIVSYVHKGSEEVDITIRYPESDKGGLDILKSIEIPNRRDGLVPLSRVAHFEIKEGFTTIRHKDAIKIINVTADIDSDKITSQQLNALVQKNQNEWLGDLSDKINVNYGGEEEKNNESARSLAIAFMFALIGIFFILAIQFNNLTYPLIVMLAIPFGAIGIIISVYLHDIYWMPMPLSFFSMLGMVALTGVVVNSSLILLVFIQRALQDGVEVMEAIINAGRRRLRAVLLTATTTVVGLLPTAYGWGGSDPFVQPIALALSSGLMFATVVTLISIPATFAVGVDIKNVFKKISQIGKK